MNIYQQMMIFSPCNVIALIVFGEKGSLPRQLCERLPFLDSYRIRIKDHRCLNNQRRGLGPMRRDYSCSADVSVGASTFSCCSRRRLI